MQGRTRLRSARAALSKARDPDNRARRAPTCPLLSVNKQQSKVQPLTQQYTTFCSMYFTQYFQNPEVFDMLEELKIMKQTSGSDIEASRALKLCSVNIFCTDEHQGVTHFPPGRPQ